MVYKKRGALSPYKHCEFGLFDAPLSYKRSLKKSMLVNLVQPARVFFYLWAILPLFYRNLLIFQFSTIIIVIENAEQPLIIFYEQRDT